MNNYKYLAKNVGVLTISNFATKILGFFLVPLYTNVLSTTEYGIYNLFNTTVFLLVPLLTLNIQDATARFSMDEQYSKKEVLSYSFSIFLKGFFILILFSILCFGLDIFPTFNEYIVEFILMYIFQALSGIMVSFARGCGRMITISISSVVSSTIFILLNILFLVYLKWGLLGYFIASIVSSIAQVVYITIDIKLWNYTAISWNKNLSKEMKNYSTPLIANSLSWWVSSSSDSYIVTWLCGTAENGIYSVASKIPSILDILQTVFTQAWSLSAVKNFDAKDQNNFFSNLYGAYNCLMILACSFLILLDKVIAHILYSKDFYVAWKCVPFLLISVVFGALSGYLGGIFTALKRADLFAKSTIFGAIANIIMNFILVPKWGAVGASIATAISYIMVWGIRFSSVKKYLAIKVNILRDIFAYFVLTMQAILILIIANNQLAFRIELILFVFLCLIYHKEILKWLYGLKTLIIR